MPALLTHFSPIPGGLDQTLEEVPAAMHRAHRGWRRHSVLAWWLSASQVALGLLSSAEKA